MLGRLALRRSSSSPASWATTAHWPASGSPIPSGARRIVSVEVRPGDVGAGEVGVLEVGSAEVGVTQGGLDEERAGKIGLAQVCAHEARAGTVTLREGGASGLQPNILNGR